jgi:hypothetical protein
MDSSASHHKELTCILQRAGNRFVAQNSPPLPVGLVIPIGLTGGTTPSTAQRSEGPVGDFSHLVPCPVRLDILDFCQVILGLSKVLGL